MTINHTSAYLKVKDALQYLNLCCLLLLVATLPFYYEYRKLMIILFFATYLLEWVVSMRWKSVNLNPVRCYFLALLLFFLWIFLYYPFEANQHLFRVLMDRRLALLGFAVVGFGGLNEKIKLKYVLNTIVITTVALIAYIMFYCVGFDKLLHGDNLPYLFMEERVNHVNTHMMFNFFLNLSLISIWHLLSSGWLKLGATLKVAYIAATPVILYFLLTTEGRGGFLTCIVISMLIVWQELRKRKKWLGWVTLSLMPPVALLGMVMHRRVLHVDILQEPRLYLWKIALPLIKERPILGHGMAAAQEKFTDLRDQTLPPQLKGAWDEYALVDVHNQYLQTAMEFGLVGLALLLLIYLAPLWLVSKENKGITLLVTLMVLIQSTFDSFLNGQQFGVTFGILAVVLLGSKQISGFSKERIMR
jgi:O-antigen ligase